LGWSDGCYSDPTYDAMYEEQRSTLDPEQRKVKIDEMQRYIYDQVPVLALAYPKILEAYRTDRFTGWTPAPGDDGPVVFGYGDWTYLNLRPVAGTAADEAGGSGGGGTPVGVWIGIGSLVLLGAGWAVMRRRRDDEEA
jgi:peptide/nickel transport system substrate-binding protein